MVLLASPFIGATAQSNRLAVTGRVLSASGAPLVGAEVSVAVGDNPGATFGRADASGAYRLNVARGAASLLVTARLLGHAPQFRRVAVTAADSVARVPEMRLVAIAAALPPVRTVATRALPPRENHYADFLTGDVSTTTDMSSFLTTDLTGDLAGDAALGLAILPAVSLTADARSFSVAGLGGDQNRVALNGVDFGGTVPRGAAASRVRLSGYDPATSMSGGLVDQRFYSGSFVFRRGVQITLDAPALQAASGPAIGLGQRALHPVVSATIGGPARWLVNRYTISVQGERRSSTVATLASADASTLAALNIPFDSARRLIAALAPLGLANNVAAAHQTRSTVQGRVFGRFDFTRPGVDFGYQVPDGRTGYGGPSNNGTSTYLIAGGSWTDSKGSMLSPAAFPLADAPSYTRDVYLQLADSRAIHEVVLNEMRSTLTVGSAGTRPTLAIPSASVLLESPATTDGASFAFVQAAGMGVPRSAVRDWMWRTTNETQWATLDNRHTLKVIVEGSLQHAASERDASLGSFSFNSLQNFVANRPATFTRSLADSRSDISVIAGAIGFGDKFRPTKNFGIQYGLRAEHYTFASGAAVNPSADSVFGASGRRLPSVTSLSPMAGFTWNLGPRNRQGYANTANSLTGGIRDYRGVIAARGLEAFASETGLARDALRLMCIGEAVPAPEWAKYFASPAHIPSECAGGAASPFAQSAPPLTLLAANYALSHSWRADLQYTRQLMLRTTGSLGGTMAWNTNQPGWNDLNFQGGPQFLLQGESSRPVFANASTIVPSSGAVLASQSRRDPAYGAVMERRSELRSRAMSLVATVDYRPMVWGNDSRMLLPINATYVLSDTRTQANGFGGTTGGDPRNIAWERGTFSRHVVQVASLIRIPDVGMLSVGMQVRSGQSYTPAVSGDINGDGQANDRAFIFDPTLATTDTGVGRRMASLLASATAAGSCLRAQVGTIARARSCAGPWTATTNTSITLDPRITHMYNRGTVRFHVFNVLGGIDQLLHGTSGMRGWGQQAYPDATLLRVRGFDAANQRFIYAVNPQFGSTTAARAYLGTPFRIALDVQLNLGPNIETGFLQKNVLRLQNTRSASEDSVQMLASIKGRYLPLFERLQFEELLALTNTQLTALAQLDNRLSLFRDSAYAAFVGAAVRAPSRDMAEVGRRYHDLAGSIRRSQWVAAQEMWQLLTPTQTDLLKGGIVSLPSVLFTRPDEKQLERDLKRWQYAP